MLIKIFIKLILNDIKKKIILKPWGEKVNFHLSENIYAYLSDVFRTQSSYSFIVHTLKLLKLPSLCSSKALFLTFSTQSNSCLFILQTTHDQSLCWLIATKISLLHAVKSPNSRPCIIFSSSFLPYFLLLYGIPTIVSSPDLIMISIDLSHSSCCQDSFLCIYALIHSA